MCDVGQKPRNVISTRSVLKRGSRFRPCRQLCPIPSRVGSAQTPTTRILGPLEIRRRIRGGSHAGRNSCGWPIEHLKYPRSLRYDAIIDFKNKLGEKVKATHAAGRDDPEYSPFLKSFKRYKTAGIQTETVDGTEMNRKMLEDIKTQLSQVTRQLSERPQGDWNRKRSYSDEILVGPVRASVVRSVRDVIEKTGLHSGLDYAPFVEFAAESAHIRLRKLGVNIVLEKLFSMVEDEFQKQLEE